MHLGTVRHYAACHGHAALFPKDHLGRQVPHQLYTCKMQQATMPATEILAEGKVRDTAADTTVRGVR